MDTDNRWMVIVRWKGGRDNKPPAGHAIPLSGVSELQARNEAICRRFLLPDGCSTTIRAERMPDYLN